MHAPLRPSSAAGYRPTAPSPTPSLPLPSPTYSDLRTPTTPSSSLHASELYHDPPSQYDGELSPNPDQDGEDGEEFGFSQPDDIKRRRRTTPEELAVLEAEYAKCTLPDAKNRVRIGQMTNMSARSVQIWFQNKRQTDKRKAQGLTRRPPRRVPVNSQPQPNSDPNSQHSHSQPPAQSYPGQQGRPGSLARTCSTPVLSEAEFELRRKRKTLEQAALDAQRRGPTSPLPPKDQELAAALAIARMHSAPFNPQQQQQQRRPLGQLSVNTLHPHPQMHRYASAQQLPASFRASRPEAPALVRAYSMPSHGMQFKHSPSLPSHAYVQQPQPQPHQQRDDPLWERMLSSPNTSPYIAPFMRKRSLDSVPTLGSNHNSHSAPFGARSADLRLGMGRLAKRQRLSLSPAPTLHEAAEDSGSDVSAASDDEGAPLSASGTECTYSNVSQRSQRSVGSDTSDGTEGGEVTEHEHEPEQEEPELSFEGSVSSQSSEIELATPNTSVELLVLSPSLLDRPRDVISAVKVEEVKEVSLAGNGVKVDQVRMEGLSTGKVKQETEVPRDWEKEAAELLCFMASGKGEQGRS